MRIAFDLTTALGIGDAICGIYAAAGIAAAGHSVVLSTKHHPWLVGCQAPVGFGDYGKTGLDAAVKYQEQLIAQKTARHGENRAAWYIRNMAERRGMELAQIAPIVPEFRIPLESPPVPGPYIVMNPFSAHTERVWSGAKWRELALLLLSAGITPVGIGATRDAKPLHAIFRDVKGARFFWQQSPAWVRSTMRQSMGFIGNDSGMTHVAASLGVPTVAITAHLRPEYVFSPGRVTGVVPDMARFACRFCGWQKPVGFRYGKPCLPVCEALTSISVAAVFEAVQQTCLLNQPTEAIAA